ncbi:hypothetical protein SAMN04487894_101288 [Niabella drilacis]|uniref:Uncharacterized protein n=2 Tax=Niabella drilacis (strain DSM 25811 / CCM 8410 / CCUG 62505 / LMG 26954 / E90) TaxID=1285928 RepID=A0A1G6IP93_NIADE|nr:hypothetical protein SAMN04487894_101288 [Niabella drilacis]
MTGTALWCFKHEVLTRNKGRDMGLRVSGAPPFHQHATGIALTGSALELSGTEYYSIPLDRITQLYIGFDEYYTKNLVHNFGLGGQPLRIATSSGQVMYFFIDYHFFGNANKSWFNQIKAQIV